MSQPACLGLQPQLLLHTCSSRATSSITSSTAAAAAGSGGGAGGALLIHSVGNVLTIGKCASSSRSCCTFSKIQNKLGAALAGALSGRSRRGLGTLWEQLGAAAGCPQCGAGRRPSPGRDRLREVQQL
jgi:hypothetical protein